ncbi:hypothetical protein B0H21DRAFT_706601 [Amylocystis lapponica]|nr:hypothetical protein B0H21DRAFT_706601 [Amylocystis lapponica]
MDVGLLKVPLLLSAAYCIHLQASPPQPPPKLSEEAKFVGVEPWGLRATARWLGHLVVRSTWLTSTCECAVLLAHAFPAHALSRAILSALIRVPGARPVRASPIVLAGWALIVSGALIRRACFRELGRFFTFELSLREDHRLITSGPYGVVRHPSYAGGILGAVGLVMLQTGPGSWWAECVMPWSTPEGLLFNSLWLAIMSGLPIVFLRRPVVEDRILRAQFGKQWDEWAARTTYRLFPGIY